LSTDYVLVFLVVSFLLAFPPISFMHSSSPHSCYMPYLSHPPWHDHSNIVLYYSILLHLFTYRRLFTVSCTTARPINLINFKSLKVHYMFRPIWPSSDVKSIWSNEETAAFFVAAPMRMCVCL
jgi:hypothetical protein